MRQTAYRFAHWYLAINPLVVIKPGSRAAYWDGKNDVGEQVASGVYFTR